MEYSEEEYVSAEDSSSENNVEDELYSVLHFTDFTNGVPDELKDKYDIYCDENGQIKISLKMNAEVNRQKSNGVGPVANCGTNDQNKEAGCLNNRTSNQLKRKIPVVTISDSDSEVDIVINTEPPKKTCCTINLDQLRKSDTTKQLNWKDIDCPKTWTKSMKRFYNKPSNRLRNFDHREIIQKLRESNSNWKVNTSDLRKTLTPRTKCGLCKARGHSKSQCPKKRRVCFMCGFPGHQDYLCPERMCLNCGKRGSAYRFYCEECHGDYTKRCSLCKNIGHSEELCPETWRIFHSTINENDIEPAKIINTGKIVCCNCSEEGHLYEQCRRRIPTMSQLQHENMKRKEKSFQKFGQKDTPKKQGRRTTSIPKSIDLNEMEFKKFFRRYKRRGLKIVIRRRGNRNLVVAEGDDVCDLKKFRRNLLKRANLPLKNPKKNQLNTKKKNNGQNSCEVVL